MGERSVMHTIMALAIAAMMSALMFGGTPAQAAPAGGRDANAGIEISSQATIVRTRPRIRINPRYPRRPYPTLYPLPYGIDYPGPNAVRQCASRLVPEYRPSGTVIVPRMWCRWAWR
jgi:hypothetical protein